MGFRQRINHKNNCVYYRLGRNQRPSRPQNYITGTQEVPREQGKKKEEEEEKGERRGMKKRRRKKMIPPLPQLPYFCMLLVS